MDNKFMTLALEQAEIALEKAEVPVGAVLVKDGLVIGVGHNTKETLFDPTGHGEINAIREASKHLNSWRLTDTTLYVTLEPCIMCMGAILHARINRLVFGATDPKAGACGSVYDISNEPKFNHSVKVTGGVLKEQSSEILKNFFSNLRSTKLS